jgi:hypothetical protein
VKAVRRWWVVVAALFVVGIVTAALVRERVRTPDGYTFTVAAGEDPDALQLTFPAATLIEIDRDGRLVIRHSDRSMRIARAEAMQDGRRIDVRFVLDRDGDVRFVVGDYDATRPLIVTAR